MTMTFDPTDVWTFGDRIRKARRSPLIEARPLSQQEMADALEVPVGRYSAWEAGHSEPRRIVETAAAVSRVTGYPTDWLLGLRSSSWNGGEADRPTCIQESFDFEGAGVEAVEPMPTDAPNVNVHSLFAAKVA